MYSHSRRSTAALASKEAALTAADARHAAGAARLQELQSMLGEREARLERLTASLDALKAAQDKEVRGGAARAAAAERRRIAAEAQHAHEVSYVANGFFLHHVIAPQVAEWKAQVEAHKRAAEESRARADAAVQAQQHAADEAAVEMAVVRSEAATLQAALATKQQEAAALQVQLDALRQVGWLMGLSTPTHPHNRRCIDCPRSFARTQVCMYIYTLQCTTTCPGLPDATQQLEAAAAAHEQLQNLHDTATQQLQEALERCCDLEAQLARSATRPTVDCTVQAAVATADANQQAVERIRQRPVMKVCAVALVAAGALAVAAHGPRKPARQHTPMGDRRPREPTTMWTLRSVLALGRV